MAFLPASENHLRNDCPDNQNKLKFPPRRSKCKGKGAASQLGVGLLLICGGGGEANKCKSAASALRVGLLLIWIRSWPQHGDRQGEWARLQPPSGAKLALRQQRAPAGSLNTAHSAPY